jgi:hypothetical protein
MVSVAQLVERWIVAPVVVGSIPITHPNSFNHFRISVDLEPQFVNFGKSLCKLAPLMEN